MGVRAIMVDRARVTGKAAQPAVIDGSTVMVPVRSDWFRCRLELPNAAPEQQPQNFSRRVIRTPTLYVLPDDDGSCPAQAEQTVEVESDALGAATFRVTSAPRPWRKKRRVIGYEVELARIDERQRGTATDKAA